MTFFDMCDTLISDDYFICDNLFRYAFVCFDVELS